MLSYDESNLKKHEVNRQEVDQVLDSRNLSTRVFDLPPARNGNERAMVVGLTLQVDCRSLLKLWHKTPNLQCSSPVGRRPETISPVRAIR